MGFYGNITNTSKTQFQFDRIYANRYEMERKKTTDGIYIGRYVLIEYDQEIDREVFKPQFYKVDGRFFTTKDITAETELKINVDVKEHDIIKITPEHNSDPNEGIELYECAGAVGNIAQFVLVVDGEDYEDNYVKNFAIDKKEYGAGRGYDSTAWQKIYQDGKEKYIMIAELNSVVPTFDISPDAPTLEPIQPHFDSNSTNVYYKLHSQPQWGFRIKEETPAADGSTSTDTANKPSDVHVNHRSYTYDKETGKLSPKDYAYHGAIYFNKDGFDSALKTRNNGLVDDIQLSPTGKSGTLYNSHSGVVGEMSANVDTLEFSMMLPSLGNAISDIWDLVYDDPGNNNSRNQDIKWDSVHGVRLVHEDPEGNGFTYSTDEVETLAGCINSVHDLMGMIIENPAELNPDLMTTDKIYYHGGKYYKKNLEYEFTPIEVEITDYNQIARYKEVEVIPYVPNRYFYKDGNNYLSGAQASFIEGVNYYRIAQKIENVSAINYLPNTFYTKDANNNYFLETAEEINFNKKYYQFDIIKSKDIYFVDTYYEKVSKNNEDSYVLAKDKNMIPGKQYYKIVYVEDKENKVFDEELNAWVPALLATFQPIELQSFSPTGMWIKDGDNYKLMNTAAKDTQYYSIENIREYNRLYQSGKYYYLDGANYILDFSPNYNAEREYLTLTPQLMQEYFYVKNKFYYKTPEGIYVLDTADSWTDKIYYVKGGLYVYEDQLGLFAKGSLWNEEVIDIPDEVTLAVRSDKWTYKELDGFARTLNTIHGLILQCSNLLKADDLLTRDNRTVQGCINILNDTIALFGKHAPDQFMIVDDYGRYTSAQLTTAQDYTVENVHLGLDTNASRNPEEDKFILATVDGDPINPTITILHNKTSHNNTAIVSNKNETTEVSEGLNHHPDDTLILHTPWVDNMGHIAGYNTETVTLPYGYTKIKTSNSANTTASSAEDSIDLSAINAKSTLDTLKVSGANKWIQAVATSEDDGKTSVFNIYHSAVDELPSTTSEINYNNTNVNGSLAIADIGDYDNAGHVTEVRNRICTLPFNYKTVKIANSGSAEKTVSYSRIDGDLVANNHIADMTIDTGNRWINLNADIAARKVTLYHAPAGDIVSTGAVGETGARNLKFGDSFKVLQIGIDEAGHVAALAARDMTLPTLTISANVPTGEIITGLATSADGVITPTTVSLANMSLKNFTYDNTLRGQVSTDDSLAAALSKLQVKLDGDKTVDGSVDQKINTAVTNLINGAPEAMDTFNEVYNWIVADESGTAELIERVSQNETDITALKNKFTADTTVDGSIGQIIESMNSDIYERLEDVELGLQGASETEGVMKWYQGPTAPAVGTDDKVVNGYSMWINTNTGKIHFYNMVTKTWEAINAWQ